MLDKENMHICTGHGIFLSQMDECPVKHSTFRKMNKEILNHLSKQQQQQQQAKSSNNVFIFWRVGSIDLRGHYVMQVWEGGVMGLGGLGYEDCLWWFVFQIIGFEMIPLILKLLSVNF